jgi:hypothetical protein
VVIHIIVVAVVVVASVLTFSFFGPFAERMWFDWGAVPAMEMKTIKFQKGDQLQLNITIRIKNVYPFEWCHFY